MGRNHRLHAGPSADPRPGADRRPVDHRRRDRRLGGRPRDDVGACRRPDRRRPRARRHNHGCRCQSTWVGSLRCARSQPPRHRSHCAALSYRRRFATRRRTSTALRRDLRPLFDPHSLAIVGASSDPAKWGYALARNALKGAHRRSVFLVNRRGEEILGQPSYRSLAELPQPPELVAIVVRPAGFEAALDDALRAGARAIVAITSGLGEKDSAGLALQRAAADRVRAAGAVLVGPNCLGIADTGTALDLTWDPFRPGPVDLMWQSGKLGLELAQLGYDAGLGFSRFVSVGNQADVDAAECVQSLIEHERTRAIALYVEDFGDGRAFASIAASAAAAGKPVVLLTVGASRARVRAAQSLHGATGGE